MMNISSIILAAGASSRMGRPKQLLDWGGIPLVRAVALEVRATGIDDIVVVTGAAQHEVVAALAGLSLRVVENPGYAEGQSSSLRVGVAALEVTTNAVLIVLGDQPFVTAQIMTHILSVYQTSGAMIIAPRYRGVRGNPVLFDRAVFAELLKVSGDQGARSILAAQPERITYVDFEDERPLIDIDTPEVYTQLIRHHD